ncbi:MAG TPA: nucleotide pyrophosphohydrolase [Thiotrichales bacterium]|nr:nucleotide pyrophosphohydrolase [Thiotrichales bacterium]
MQQREERLAELQQALREFAHRRDWEQFHTPKNLVMALIVEAAELVEHFQWLTPEQADRLDEGVREEVRMEMADIFIYLLRLAERLDVDLLAAAEEKMAINEERFPVERVRGKAGRPET